MLWLALHLPSLPLDALLLSPTPTPPEPWAVVAPANGGEQVIVCNTAASALGIRPGQRRSAALALAGNLNIAPRQVAQEQALLENLASWCLQFTPTVCLDPPAGLLLEIEGCLRYFKGLARLRQLVSTGLAERELAVQLGIAPTPLAASWLARLSHPQAIRHLHGLTSTLPALPLAALHLPDTTQATLQALGLQRLGEVLALPRAGLGRRFGADFLLLLDRLLGLQPDPRAAFVPPDHFNRRVELNWATDQVEALGFVAKRLLVELGAFLLGRGLGVQQLSLRLEHDNKTHSDCQIGLGEPTRSAEAMLAICRERLARLALLAPVNAVSLQAKQLHRLDGAPLNLFGDANRHADFALLRARLAARLGEDAVRHLVTVADHRPELAWRPVAQPTASQPLAVGERPGWLLAQPQLLEIRDERPWYGEPLRLLSRAERIESGWWDGETVARDYYRAEGPSGRQYWLYQPRGEGRWFLHGLFG